MSQKPPSESCPERVWRGGEWSGRYEACAKPAKRDGLCGIHANAKDKAAARAKEDAERRSRTLARDKAKDRVLNFLDTYEGTAFPNAISTMSDGYTVRDLLASDLRLLLGKDPSGDTP